MTAVKLQATGASVCMGVAGGTHFLRRRPRRRREAAIRTARAPCGPTRQRRMRNSAAHAATAALGPIRAFAFRACSFVSVPQASACVFWPEPDVAIAGAAVCPSVLLWGKGPIGDWRRPR